MGIQCILMLVILGYILGYGFYLKSNGEKGIFGCILLSVLNILALVTLLWYRSHFD
jgi:membrane protein DedA with SNARE-associated domain